MGFSQIPDSVTTPGVWSGLFVCRIRSSPRYMTNDSQGGLLCWHQKYDAGKYTIHDKLTQSLAPNYIHTDTRAHMPTCCWWSSYLRVIFFIIRMYVVLVVFIIPVSSRTDPAAHSKQVYLATRRVCTLGCAQKNLRTSCVPLV